MGNELMDPINTGIDAEIVQIGQRGAAWRIRSHGIGIGIQPAVGVFDGFNLATSGYVDARARFSIISLFSRHQPSGITIVVRGTKIHTLLLDLYFLLAAILVIS